MMTPVGRLVLVQTDRQARTRRRDGLGDDAGADRPDDRPAARRLHHNLLHLALDLPDQHSDRHCRHHAGERSIDPDIPASVNASRSTFTGRRCSGIGVAGLAFGHVGRRAWVSCHGGSSRHWCAIGGGGDDALCASRPHDRAARRSISHLLSIPTLYASVVGGFFFRRRYRRDAVPVAASNAARFRVVPFASGLVTFTSVIGAFSMKALAPPPSIFGFRFLMIWTSLIGASFRRWPPR